MLIKFGSIVTDGRGKLGGHVYSKNRGGAYVRTNAIPSNPQTQYQQAGRGRLGGLSQAWSGLTLQEIEAWNAAAPDFPRTNVFGDTKLLSGKNLFVGLNYMLLLVGESRIDSPPAPSSIEVPTDLEVDQPDYSQGAEKWEIIPTTTGTVEHLVVEATAPLTAGTSYFRNRFRVIQIEDNFSSGPVDVLDAYTDRFGTPTTGKRVAFRVFSVNDSGQKSPGFQESVVIQ